MKSKGLERLLRLLLVLLGIGIGLAIAQLGLQWYRLSNTDPGVLRWLPLASYTGMGVLGGLVFLLLSATGLREYIAKALPDCLKKAIPAGIGLFIAFIGFQNAGVIESNPYTLLQFVDMHGHTWTEIVPALVALLGVVIIGVLAKLRVKGNVILGVLASTILYYLFMGQAPSFAMTSVGQSFKDFGSPSKNAN